MGIVEDNEEAYEYAMQKLCTAIPDKYLPGSTYWDDTIKKCRISEKGCNMNDIRSPFSQRQFDNNGNDISDTYLEVNTSYKDFWKYNPPEELIYKGIPTEQGGATFGCARSNFLFRQFCEYPKTRGGGETIRGVTDVPKFNFVTAQGKESCKVTKEYCDAKGLSYNKDKQKCIVPYSQKFGEFFGGSVFTRSLRSGTTLPNPADPKQLEATVKKFQQMSDKRLKRDINIFKPDFLAPGINLYSFRWKPEALKLYGFKDHKKLGFLADELPPDNVRIDENGYKYIITLENDFLSRKINMFFSINNIIESYI